MIEITDISVELNEKEVIEQINSLLNDDTLTKIQTLFAETIDPWTPFLSGQLHEQIKVDKDGVEYLVPYSADKYYGTVYTKTSHPLATSHWDEVAMQTEMSAFEQKVKDILVERTKELYG